MGLVTIIPTMSVRLVYHFIPWSSSANLLLLYLFLLPWVCCLILWASLAHLLLLYLLLLLWACWLSMLSLQPTGLVSLFLYRFAPCFLLIFLIVGFLLLFDPLSKMGLNSHINKLNTKK